MKLSGCDLFLCGNLLLCGCSDSMPNIIGANDKPFEFEYKSYHYAVSTLTESSAVNSKIDFVFVVDNSGSMGTHQTNLKNNFSKFIETLSQKNSDYTISLISSDTSNSPFLGTPTNQLTSSTSNLVQTFQGAVNRLGTGGDGAEKFFEPLKKWTTSYPSMVRNGAFLAVINVTDTEDQSQRPSTEYIEYISDLKGGDLSQIDVYGVLGGPSFSCTSQDDTPLNYPTSRHKSVIDYFGGAAYSLCASDFGDTLVALAKSVIVEISKNSARIKLDAVPRDGSLKVLFKGEELQQGTVWEYEASTNEIVFYTLEFADGQTDLEIEIKLSPAS